MHFKSLDNGIQSKCKRKEENNRTQLITCRGRDGDYQILTGILHMMPFPTRGWLSETVRTYSNVQCEERGKGDRIAMRSFIYRNKIARPEEVRNSEISLQCCSEVCPIGSDPNTCFVNCRSFFRVLHLQSNAVGGAAINLRLVE